MYRHPDRIAHTMVFYNTNCGTLAETKSTSMGSPGGIDPMTCCTMSGHSTTKAMAATGLVSNYLWSLFYLHADKLC